MNTRARRNQKNFDTRCASTKFHLARRWSTSGWHQIFLETRSCEAALCFRTPTVDRVVFIYYYVENSRQSLKRGAAGLDIYVYTIQPALKDDGMKCYHPETDHQVKPTDITKWSKFAQTILNKIKESPNCFLTKQCFISVEE